MKITGKRVRVEETVEMEDDRISVFPDALLLEILSRLPSIKCAIRTGTLSRRWKYLWTSVPALIFRHYDLNLPLSDFVSIVDKTLAQCRQTKLRAFVLDVRYDIQFESQVNNWIRYAINCGVEVLDLRSYVFPLESDVLNHDFFNNSCFTALHLSCRIFKPISWKQLRSLSISGGYLDIDLIENISSGSPLLETLKFSERHCYWHLGITSRNIKKLKFFQNKETKSLRVKNVIRYAISCNVEELDLSFHKDKDFKAKFLLNEYFFVNSCITSLRLSGCIFNPTGAIHWRKLRSLCIQFGDLDENVIGNILAWSPLLETLELDDCYGYSRLDITSKSVKKVVISRYTYHDELETVTLINAPYILSLTIQGYLDLLKLLLSNVSSLVEANLDFGKCDFLFDTTSAVEEHALADEVMLKGFIRSLRHVRELKIGNYFWKDPHRQAMLENYKQAMLENYKQDMLEKYELDRDPLMGLSGNCNADKSYVGSASEEVQQLKEKIEHEHAD